MERIDCRLMVFAKAPIPGRVKTRLIPVIGEKPASELYEKMVFHCLAEGIKAGVGPVDLWCTPSSDHPFFIHCAEKFQVKLHDQPEGDLGQRMGYAFSETLRISTYALLMGSDCPSLTSMDIRAAKDTLEKGHDAVIVPAEDGGYALLGLRLYAKELFSGIFWGTESVIKQTLMRLRGLGWQWQELPERWDVDRPEDLRRIISTPV